MILCNAIHYYAVLVGKPMYFMEAALGQFGQVGPLQVWAEMLPCAVGVGVAMVIISLIVAIYYNVIMAYCLFYLFNSFRSVLPWTVCNPEWADKRCFVRNQNSTMEEMEMRQTSEEQYWERKVLDITPTGLGEPGDLGEIKLDLAFFLLVSWLVVLLCLAKGVKSSGKVVYFSATFPYLVLLVLLVLGLTLPGAGDGLYYLFVPKWEKLASFTVWRRAAGQVRSETASGRSCTISFLLGFLLTRHLLGRNHHVR
jgi:solute carrier family 6 amino acid transporter-like protein 5/7/9/14